MDTRQYEKDLAEQYNYSKLGPVTSAKIRQLYINNIPKHLMLEGANYPIFTKYGTMIAHRYNRIVVGDYGAFVEFDPVDAVKTNFIVKPGQEYRINDPHYSRNIKYWWYTVADWSDVKIYFQRRTVDYADYQPDKYYVSVHEAFNFLLFTHTDLDGYGSAIMVKKVYPDIVVKNCNYGFDLEPEYRRMMAHASHIIFTDISIARETAELLNQTGKFLLLMDHHESAYRKLDGLDYPWFVFDDTKSGALIAQEYLARTNSQLKPYKEFAEAVSDYDLWNHKIPESVMLQFLWSNDHDGFTQRFLDNPELKFTESEQKIIDEQVQARKDSYDQALEKMEILTDCEGMTFGLIPEIKTLLSLVVSDILTNRPDLDYIAVLTNGGISFRSKHFTVRNVAEALGGGGHDLAAGVRVPEMMDVRQSIIERKVIMYDIGAYLNSGGIQPK